MAFKANGPREITKAVTYEKRGKIFFSPWEPSEEELLDGESDELCQMLLVS